LAGTVLLGVVGAMLVGGVIPLGAASSGGSPRPEPPSPATGTSQEAGPANNSPRLEADPTDGRFVALATRLDAPDYNCGLQVSGDGGNSWTPAEPVPRLPRGAEKCYAPEIDFDAQGRLYFLFVGLAGPGNQPMGVFLTSSTDRARSFSPPRKVLGALNFGVRMAVHRSSGPIGRIHLVWLHATSDPGLGSFGTPPNPVMASHSDDGGKSFSRPVQVSDPVRARVAAPTLSVGEKGLVHVGYFDLGDDAIDYQGLEGPTYEGKWSLIVTTSADRGGHFSRGRVVDGSIMPGGRVMLIFTMPPASLASWKDSVCASWTDARFGDDDALLRCSTDGGRHWGPVVRLNRDHKGNGASQYLPKIAFSPSGRLDAVYFDRILDPSNLSATVTLSSSADSFTRPVRLNRKPSNIRIGQRYEGKAAAGLVEFGARLGLLSSRDSVLAAWPDT
ncbi:MAG: sialidase family protein, partial [Actinomycetota bacterium]